MFGRGEGKEGGEQLTCKRDCPLFAVCSAEREDKIRAARAADTRSLAKGGLYPEEIDGLDLREDRAQADADADADRFVRNCPGPELQERPDGSRDVECQSPLRDQMVVKTS